MRSRLALSAVAAVAVLAAACGRVDGSSVARVGDVEIPFSQFDQVMAISSQNIGLTGDALRIATAAVDAGLLRRDLLDASLVGIVQDPEVDASAFPHLPPASLDALYNEQVEQINAAETSIADRLEQVGVTEARWRAVFDQVVVAELAGLFQTGGEPFDLDRVAQVTTMQSRALSQLIEIEFTKQLVDELGLTVTQEEIDAQLEFVRAAYETEEEFLAVIARQGYDLSTYRDLVVASQVRTTALQGVTDPALLGQLQAFFEQIDIDVAPRFGDFDVSLGIQPPQPLDG